eukprot:1148716-Pelagomonas_calceolata.AAC.8
MAIQLNLPDKLSSSGMFIQLNIPDKRIPSTRECVTTKALRQQRRVEGWEFGKLPGAPSE